MEIEPLKKVEKDIFYKRYIYFIFIGMIIALGTSYSITFFTQNNNLSTVSMSAGALTVNVSNNSINLSGLSRMSDSDGVLLAGKELTLSNVSSVNGKIVLTLARTSGLALTDMRYALFYEDTESDVILTIADMPSNGVIYESAILPSESMTLKLVLWPKNSYSGAETTFVGTLNTTVSRDRLLAADYFLGLEEVIDNSNYFAADSESNYVWFNCDEGYNEGDTHCSLYQVVGVSSSRVVVTATSNYENASSRTDSGIFSSTLSIGKDESLIKSLSTDGKNFALAKTVYITGGDGSATNPYSLSSDTTSYQDYQKIAAINYLRNSSTLYTQPIYTGRTNYISNVVSGVSPTNWSDWTNTYQLGDTVSFVADKTLYVVSAGNLSYSHAGIACNNVQCAIEAIADILS